MSQLYHFTDLGNSKRLVRHHGLSIRYCHPWKKWLTWDGARWKTDDTGEIDRRAEASVLTIYNEAEKVQGADYRKLVGRHAVRSEGEARIRAMVTLARSAPGIPVIPAQLDTDPWLLNVLNGTVDLRTGLLLPHRRENLITKLAPVIFDPDAVSPIWLWFLTQIMAENQPLIDFLQRGLGYGLTGDVSEQILFILFGTGANGKTTLIETILSILGDYAMKARPDLLMVKTGNNHPTEIADLFGKRFVASTETEQGHRLSEVLVKEATGGDRLRARRMREDFWEFIPTHKIYMATNHKPIIQGTDYAIWRRPKLIPFSVTIPKGERDKELLTKLKDEAPGILAWLVKGCVARRTCGLNVPPEVEAATLGYRQEMDVIGNFLGEMCFSHEAARVRASELYRAYIRFCEDAGEASVAQRGFGIRLKERGFKNSRISSGEHRGRFEWEGIGLL